MKKNDHLIMHCNNLKAYISAPITGYPIDERKKLFDMVAKQLETFGFIPVNPIQNGIPDYASYEVHMKADIRLLLDCDAVVISSKWESSKGCRLEHDVAETCGIPIIGSICEDDSSLDLLII